MIDNFDKFGLSKMIEHLELKFQRYNFFFYIKLQNCPNCLSKSMDAGFESPSPGSLSPPRVYEASLTYDTFIHTWL